MYPHYSVSVFGSNLISLTTLLLFDIQCDLYEYIRDQWCLKKHTSEEWWQTVSERPAAIPECALSQHICQTNGLRFKPAHLWCCVHSTMLQLLFKLFKLCCNIIDAYLFLLAYAHFFAQQGALMWHQLKCMTLSTLMGFDILFSVLVMIITFFTVCTCDDLC